MNVGRLFDGAPQVSLFDSIVSRPATWIDLGVLLLLGTIHGLVQFTDKSKAIETATARATAGTRVGGATTSGVTVAGILIPLTIVAIRIGPATGESGLPPAAFADLFMATTWLVASMLFGLFTMYMTAFQGYRTSLLNRPGIMTVFGLQLIFLGVGITRFMWGTGTVVSTLFAQT